MEMDVVPFEGLGPVAFGSARGVNRLLLGEADPFRRSAWRERPSDLFFELGLILGYGEDETLDEIEVFGACRPVADGVDLLGTPRDQVLAAIRARGLEVRGGSGGEDVPAWGLGFFAKSDGDECFTSVTLHAHGVPEVEPVFFDGVSGVDPGALRILGPDGFPGAGLGMSVAAMRAALGAGMSVEVPGRGSVDVFFSPKVAVSYGGDGCARRICAMERGAGLADGVAVVGMARGECRELLVRAGVEFDESETEILVRREGISVSFSRAHDDALPVSAIAVKGA